VAYSKQIQNIIQTFKTDLTQKRFKTAYSNLFWINHLMIHSL